MEICDCYQVWAVRGQLPPLPFPPENISTGYGQVKQVSVFLKQKELRDDRNRRAW